MFAKLQESLLLARLGPFISGLDDYIAMAKRVQAERPGSVPEGLIIAAELFSSELKRWRATL